MKTGKWLFKYIKPYVFGMAFAFLLTISNTVLSNIRPLIQGKIVDEVFEGRNIDLLGQLVLALLLSILIKDVFRIIDHYILEGTSQKVIKNMRLELYNSLQKQDFKFFDSNRTGDIMNRLTGDIDSIRHFVAWVMNGMIENLFLFVTALVILGSINPVLTLVLVMITPLIGTTGFFFSRKVGPAFRNARACLSQLNTVAQENISGNRVVKAMVREEFELSKFDDANNAYKDANIKSNRIAQKYLPLLNFMANTLNVLVLVVGGWMVIENKMSIGDYVTFNSMSWALNAPMRSLGWLINDTSNMLASAEKVKEFYLAKPAIYGNKDDKNRDERLEGNVTFKNVSFSFDGNLPAINNISFEAKRGQTIAIIGETGSGKSTVANLMFRFYDVTEGEVLLDGVNVKDMSLKHVRKSMAMAMQDIFLFSDTIEGNIAYGNPDATFEEVKEAAIKADAHNFIKRMPDGYDTIVGERGVGLSGGQKQRISLARALLKNPSILILDDTTSAVDMETEKYIQEMLNRESGSRTMFIIAHRISSVKNADLILVMEKGSIIERGTHSELIRLGGKYKEVYDTQTGSFNTREGE
ncbi:MAG: ABC transporter ATP-binding protein [Clostridia bacterium]|nr:ABC transporter ATP-binding protein [Clostridia bacterium]